MQDNLHGNELSAPEAASVPSSWPQADAWKFEGFALHIHTTVCKCCSSKAVSSELFRLFVRHYPASVDRRLVRAKHFVSGFQVVKFFQPLTETPICLSCVDSLAGEKKLLVADEAAFRDAVRRSNELLAKSIERKESRAKPQLSISDLEKLLG